MKYPIALLSFVSLCMVAQGATYQIDKDHSNVSFKVRHLIGKTPGRFDSFSGTIEYDPKKHASWKVEATIDVTSINTNVKERDKHLLSKDFFDVENPKKPDYKTIKFVSKKITDVKEKKAKLHGDLTIRGITKPVELDLEIFGEAADPWGNKRTAFLAKTTINRKDFGLTWNQVLETGGLLVGEEVEIELNIEGILKK